MTCGVAALAMICRKHGKDISISYLDKMCHTSIDGISIKALSDIATKIGFDTTSIFCNTEKLLNKYLPCILYWDQKHFVVLYKISSDHQMFYVADPAKGLVSYNKEEFERYWYNGQENDKDEGVVMFLEPTPNFYANKNIEVNHKKRHFLKFLDSYIAGYKKHFIQIFIGLFVGCILQIIMPFLTQAIVDLGIKNNDIGLVWLILLGELMLVVGRTATDFIRRWLLLHISMRINISLVSDFFIKLLKLPMSFFDTKLMGDLMQRISDHGRVQDFLTGQVLGLFFTLLNFIIFGIVLFIYNPFIFIVFTIGSIVYGGWIASFLHRRKVLDYELFEQQARNQNKTYQFITSIQEIKLQDCEHRRRWEWEDIQVDLFTIQMKSLKLKQTQEAGSIFINEVKNVIITVIAATAVINNSMTLGSMLAVQYIIGQLNSPIEQLMSFIYSLQDVKISLERINEIHERENEETKVNQIVTFEATKNIKFRNVFFKYDIHALKNTLDDVSFDINEGNVIAIVGASGSGKTTLVKLMLGYYKVLSGAITIARRNINEYNMKWWRQQCGVVMQDGVIFSESIAHNIAVTDKKIDFKQLEYAARIANIHDYIMTLPLKYNTIIGHDGVGLSQGQKQRILIARAVYKNPRFIFLDEATNALDAKNELAIVKNLNEFYQGRTVVVVAHRLSTVKNANKIIVLDNGKVVEIGNHASLIEKKGVYYNLVKNQLELGN